MKDAKLLGMAEAFRLGMLGKRSSEHACFMICAPLVTFLNMHGFHLDLVHGWIKCGEEEIDHYWLRLHDGRVLDPTADQFNKIFPDHPMPKVYLGVPTHLHPVENQWHED